MQFQIINKNNIEYLKTQPDNLFDSIVTDPPYGIEFLDKDWDSNTGAVETWQECLRTLKPGGYLLAFSAARTYHHLATNIEQVGFEIRDQLMWLYASGFPKAQKIKGHEGWKTALKPAHEPIVMARKPFKGSTYKNMEQHGVGALNIDESRVPYENERDLDIYVNNIKGPLERSTAKAGDNIGMHEGKTGFKAQKGKVGEDFYTPEQGRYPSNVLGEVEGHQQYFYCPKVSRKERHCGFETIPYQGNSEPSGMYGPNQAAARKNQSTKGNNHPTVKPVELMKYLIKLVTPKNGQVLDPFCGSGSTGMAAVELGHTFTGIELDPNYVDISNRRIAAWNKKTPQQEQFEKVFENVDLDQIHGGSNTPPRGFNPTV